MPKEHAKSEERIIVMIDPRNKSSFILNHTRIKNLYAEGHVEATEDKNGNLGVDVTLKLTLRP